MLKCICLQDFKSLNHLVRVKSKIVKYKKRYLSIFSLNSNTKYLNIIKCK